jgi:N-methylhydantoinase A
VRERPVEIVSYRVRARVAVPKYEAAPEPPAAAAPAAAAARKARRDVYFDGATATATEVYERSRLPVGARFAGPAIVEQLDATTVIPPGWTAEVDRHRNLVLAQAP